MKNFIYLALAISLVACNNKPKEEDKTVSAEKNGLLFNPKHGAPGHDCSIPEGQAFSKNATATPNSLPTPTQAIQSTPTTMGQQLNAGNLVPSTPQATTAAKSSKINPPHGQPGHDCGTPVGQAIGSAKPTSTVTTTSAPAPKARTGVNPPHGEPGHDCAVAVGASFGATNKTSPPTLLAAPSQGVDSNTVKAATNLVPKN